MPCCMAVGALKQTSDTHALDALLHPLGALLQDYQVA